MPDRRVTMRDVARESGVSPATVSFVLNDSASQTIPDATRERVRAAAERLGYRPHGVARALREGSSRIVVLHTARLPHGGSSLESFIDGLTAELSEAGYALLLDRGTTPGGLDEVVASIRPRAVLDLDAVYFGEAGGDGDGTDVPDGGWVDGLAAHTATQLGYLLDRGHTAIAMAVPPAGGPLERLVELRTTYARQVLTERGGAPLELLTVGAGASEDRDALAQLRAGQPAVTAVAAIHDDSALRVLAAAAGLGIRVPDELAVIGFDDTEYGALWAPALTTVRIDAEGYGRRAARELLGSPGGSAGPDPSIVIRRASA